MFGRSKRSADIVIHASHGTLNLRDEAKALLKSDYPKARIIKSVSGMLAISDPAQSIEPEIFQRELSPHLRYDRRLLVFRPTNLEIAKLS